MSKEQSLDISQTTAGEACVDLSSQLQVVNLGFLGQESNIFELAQTYINQSFLPLFQDYKTCPESHKLKEVKANNNDVDGIIKNLSSLKQSLEKC